MRRSARSPGMHQLLQLRLAREWRTAVILRFCSTALGETVIMPASKAGDEFPPEFASRSSVFSFLSED